MTQILIGLIAVLWFHVIFYRAVDQHSGDLGLILSSAIVLLADLGQSHLPALFISFSFCKSGTIKLTSFLRILISTDGKCSAKEM